MATGQGIVRAGDRFFHPADLSIAPPIVVIGAGVAGSLLSLELAGLGLPVTLVSPFGAGQGDPQAATPLSYAAILGREAAGEWRQLQRRHGHLGWRRAGLVLHSLGAPLGWLPPDLLALGTALVPVSRIDLGAFGPGLVRALAEAGVQRLERRVVALQPRPAGEWCLQFADGESYLAERVVLAAGAGCRALWPALPPRLCTSWAGVLVLPQLSGSNPWLAQVRRGRFVLPPQLRRPELERSAPPAEPPEEPRWVVDAGLAPWGKGALLGQISWLAAEPPDPLRMEALLRAQLSQLDPELGRLTAPYRQVPVSYCTDGQPLAGAVAGAPGLWVLSGASAAFKLMPRLCRELATEIAARG